MTTGRTMTAGRSGARSIEGVHAFAARATALPEAAAVAVGVLILLAVML